MLYQYVLAAVAERDTPPEVTSTAVMLAARAGARLGFITAVPINSRAGPARARLVAVDPGHEPPASRIMAPGMPGIEIPRFAERTGADLLVLGRTARSAVARRLVGDTADAVVRRSRVPCLLLPAGGEAVGPILAAVDGSRHSAAVLDAACRLSAVTGGRVSAWTIEPTRADEPAALAVPPLARSVAAGDAVAQAARRCRREVPLVIRRGPVVSTLLDAIVEQKAAVLVLGFRRGGPAAAIEGGSIARRLLHEAPIAVLTVPI